MKNYVFVIKPCSFGKKLVTINKDEFVAPLKNKFPNIGRTMFFEIYKRGGQRLQPNDTLTNDCYISLDNLNDIEDKNYSVSYKGIMKYLCHKLRYSPININAPMGTYLSNQKGFNEFLSDMNK